MSREITNVSAHARIVYPWLIRSRTSISRGVRPRPLVNVQGLGAFLPRPPDKAQQLGARFYFDTTGVQLVQDDSGRVTGVIGKRSDGAYTQFNAAKGVILATGDYASNPEMVQEMCPELMDTFNYYYPPDNTGEGHQMGLWAGGVIERGNHSKMCHPPNGNDGKELTDSPIKSDAFLWVNQQGERFCNEDMDYVLICNRVLRQPGQVYYIVFDDDFADQRQTFRNPFGPVDESRVDTARELGYWTTADTIEELGAAFDVSGDVLAATVARYNDLVDNGVDDDFGKNALDLKPIRKAPFHMVRTYAPSDVALGGLMVDEQMRVVRDDGEAIEGLYAVGNCQGVLLAPLTTVPRSMASALAERLPRVVWREST